MAAPLSLVWDLIARDGASPVFARVAANADKAAASTAKAEGGIAGFGKKATAALGAIVSIDIAAHIVKSAAQFQRSMLLIQTQAGASAAEVRKMTPALLALAGPLGTAPEALATSLYHVESVGLRGAKALEVVKTAAEGAKVGNADLEETTNALTSAVASGIPGVQSMTQAMGALNAIVGSGDMNLSQLNEALGTGILTKAKTYGLSLTDVGAALATFGDLNIRGADAATQLRMAFEAMAKPAVGGITTLAKWGIGAKQLRVDMQQGGLNKALIDLKAHLDNAGITGNKVGGALLDAFGKKGAGGVTLLLTNFERFQTKMVEVRSGAQKFGDAWSATSHTASFAFDQIRAYVDAAGISIGLKLLPAVQGAIHGLEDVGRAVAAVSPELKVLGGTVAAMWLAFKGYQLAVAAIEGVRFAVGTMSAAFNNGLTSIRAYGAGVSATLAGNATESQYAALALQADLTATASAELDSQLAFERAEAGKALAFANTLRASEEASFGEIAAADAAATAAEMQANRTAIAAAEVSAAADTAAAEVVAAGDVAATGWAGVAGPIGLAAVGVLALVTMFHHSTSASKEATDAAKAYTDALKGDGSKASIFDAITTQLAKNNVPEKINELNKALGSVQFTGKQFATAIDAGNPALATLRTRLDAVIKAGTDRKLESAGRGLATWVTTLTPAAKTATKLLKDLNSQTDGLSKAAAKDFADTKAFSGVASSINKVAQSTKVGTKVAAEYAGMLGIYVDKNGIAAVSSATLAAAITTISSAYNTATATGNEFLGAMDAFSKSTGTAAARAALIGATLKAANGDALGFAAAMNGGATAMQSLDQGIKSAASQAVKGGESTRAFVRSIVNMKTGAIDFTKAGAAPLISGLQGIQSAGLAAAQAAYQHYRATMSGKDAADQAYKVYVGQTRGALIEEFTKLTGNAGAAKRLADKYLGMPKKVKTLIEQEGANPIVDVLNKIGSLLAYLVGKPWTTHHDADTHPAVTKIQALQDDINRIKQGKQPGLSADSRAGQRVIAALQAQIDRLRGKTVTLYVQTKGNPASVQGYKNASDRANVNAATGGYIAGPGTGTSDSINARLSNGEYVVNAAATAKNRALLDAMNYGPQKFAHGGPVGSDRELVAAVGRVEAATYQIGADVAAAFEGVSRNAANKARTAPAGRAW